MSLYSRLAPRGATGFGYGSTAEQVTEGLDLAGKTYLITGCNSGLGLETSRVLLMRGARVVGLARTVDKARDALAPLGGETVPVACELSEPDHVRAAVEAVQELDLTLDGLICNAGIMALPDRQLHHGVELQLLTNHVGHFILVTGVLDRLTPAGKPSRSGPLGCRRRRPPGIGPSFLHSPADRAGPALEPARSSPCHGLCDRD